MIWQEDTRVIVMTTNEIERGRVSLSLINIMDIHIWSPLITIVSSLESPDDTSTLETDPTTLVRRQLLYSDKIA